MHPYGHFQFSDRIADRVDVLVENAQHQLTSLTQDHVQQFVLAGKVGIQRPHAEPGFFAEVPHAHSLEPFFIADFKGGVEDAGQVADDGFLLLDLNLFPVGLIDFPVEVLPGNVDGFLEFPVVHKALC